MHKITTRAAAAIIGALAVIHCAPAARPPDPPAAAKSARPGISLQPPNAQIAGDLFEITVHGATPGATIELVAERPVTPVMPGRPRQMFRATAEFRADPAGTVALSRAVPTAGSYRSADLRGLFWSMAATQDAIPAGVDDDHARLVARQDGRELAEVQVSLRGALPEVEVTPVGAALPGALLARLPGPQRRPAIIVLGGSEGNDWTAKSMAPRLASLGYAVLGLPYYAPSYGPPNPALASLPTAFVDIPVERLEQARDWLRHAPGVDADHIALWGLSKGAEFVLLAGSKMAWPTAIIAIVPSDVVWEGWGLPGQAEGTRSSFSWRGEPLPFVPYTGLAEVLAKLAAGKPARMRDPHDRGRAAHPEAIPSARIAIENYRGPLLIAGAVDDAVWPSGEMTENLARTRRAAGLPTTALVLPDAGHLLWGSGWSPSADFALGGTPAGNAHGQSATWQATVEFLARNLPRP